MEKRKLIGPFKLIAGTFETFFEGKNFIYLLKVILIQIGIGIAAALPVVIIFLLIGGASYLATGYTNANSSVPVVATIVGLLVVVPYIIVIGSWLGASQIVAISQISSSKLISIKETLKIAWSRVWKFLGVSLVTGLMVGIGFGLFVIPGIILGLWFSFATFIAVEDNLGFEALGKSKKLVGGVFWGVFGRLLLFSVLFILVYFALNLIPLVGPILSVFVTPLYMLLRFRLYKDVLRVKEG